MPEYRLLTAKFLQAVLIGRKHLLKKHQLNPIGHLISFSECTKMALYQTYPNPEELNRYIPDEVEIKDISKKYLFTVVLLGDEHFDTKLG